MFTRNGFRPIAICLSYCTSKHLGCLSLHKRLYIDA
jgi:hypothetical protein